MVKSHNKTPNKKVLHQQAQDSWREVKKEDKENIQNRIFELLRTPIRSYPFTFYEPVGESQSESQKESQKRPLIPLENPPELFDNIQPSSNATAQKKSLDIIQKSKVDLYEYNNLLRTASSHELRSQFVSSIKKLEETILIEENRLKKLRNNAAAQQRVRKKKKENIEENIVEVYDTPGRPSFLIKNPDLLEKMHASVEFGAADYKRRKEIIKVRTIKHFREKMDEDYGIYMAKSTLQNYMQPKHPGSKEAQRHHHPAQIRFAAVRRDEMNSHVDEHYCLASVKGVKSFATAFPQDVLIISQDDKAKVPLGMAAVGRTFKTIQTTNEPVSVPDHDFPKAAKHKLVPSVYLLINPSDTNDSLRSGKVRIFIRPEYFLSTSCETHMVDLMSITKEENFREFTHNGDTVKPFWCLLTDGGPDENPRFLANITKYLLLFKKLDLDYLTVRTHAPGQSAYNPVERSMASLSGKLAGVELNAFTYGNHLGSVEGKITITDRDLGRNNFRHAGERLCELWSRDNINGHPVITTYVEDHDRADFLDIEEGSWDWIDRHAQICKYSLDIRKCKDRNCCAQPRAPEIHNLLSANNGFLPPVIRGHDGHFLNLIHTLEYFGEKLPGYDEHCPSITSDLYHSLTCRKCFRYFPSKAFLKQHTKTIHSGERVPVERVAINVVIEASKYLQQDYEYNAESTQDDENENSNDNTSQELQKEKTTKRGRGRPRNYKHN
ncbi:hypothetical protein RhiirA5_385935 [Rhizophagus irregularis]|uniref:C2H2-type domain-containing protein n=1 Tax=Rhizophagus irregularis TaxID=588596 RepID=A0A2N0NLP2_9GLOM|nr:hypothetical protein RhiirA5_385993 [Rhizophagus irregularis]PKB95553.1 hypothetical protein RhiirA5_385935 [Rhizophagus irregularis]